MARLSKPVQTSPSLTVAAAMWDRSLAVARRSPRTRQSYAYAIRQAVRVVGDVPVASLRRSDVEMIVVDLTERGWKPTSVGVVFRSLRAFFTWAVGHEDVPVSLSPMRGMPAPAIPRELVAFPSPSEMARVLSTCSSRRHHNYRGLRDEAILRLFCTTGLRLAELTNLRLSDVALRSGSPTATVVGKGDRERSVPLDGPTASAILLYVHSQRPRSPWASSDALWLGPKGPMSISGVGQMVKARAASVGVDLHPHMLRHYAIDRMLGAGLSEGDTMSISGHSTRSMLDRYGQSRRAERADRAFRALGTDL